MRTLKEAGRITGGLSKPSKMPGLAFSIPAQRCITGSKLAKIPGTVCHGCYALDRGNYRWPNVKEALERRYQKVMRAVEAEARFGEYAGGIYRARFISSMVQLINHYSPKHFRWHDAGDIQSAAHLELIAEIARLTPKTKHWIPTREITILKRWYVMGGDIPHNLTIRVSAHKIGDTMQLEGMPKGIVSSSVDGETGYQCPAPKQDNKCGDCRACWSKNCAVVNYHKH
jgi:hypothetical protein